MSRQPLPPEVMKQMVDHIALYRADPDKAHILPPHGPGDPPRTALLLTAKGRKSGRPLAVTLIYTTTPTGYCVVASKGGTPEHPFWYDNLMAEPACDVQVARAHARARARTATGAERAKLWAQMAKVHPPYDDYQKLTTREIPVVVIEPQKA